MKMKKFMSSLLMVSLFMMTSLVCAYAFADESVMEPQDFFAQMMTAIQGFGGLSTMLKISAIITLVVSSMKVSFLNALVWSKLGNAKAWVAPVLGLIAGVLGLGADGNPITVASVMAYVAAGGGAVILHELLDTIKAVPGLGPAYIGIISMIQATLGGAKKQ